MDAIAAHQLTKTYRGGIEALRGLTFSVASGSVCGFIGPNGAGKTTTISMLAGLIRPTGGSLKVLGHALPENLPSVHRQLGIAFDNHPFIPAFSATRNLRLMARFSPASEAADRIERLLALVGLSDRAKSAVGSFSRGMRQRLGIASALLLDPPIVVLDEPFAGLDPEGMRDLRGIVQQLRQEGRTVLFSSHQLTDVEQVCDDVVVIRAGQTVFEGPTQKLTGRRGVSVVTADRDRAAAVLQAARMDVELTSDGVFVADGEPEQINVLLVRKRVPVSELRPLRPSLEQRFFELMDKGRD